jgi:predicted transcriptional regulator
MARQTRHGAARSGGTGRSSAGAATQRLLTPTELEIMHVLWRLGESTAAGVQAALAPERPLAYTSVSTMLRILEQKGTVASRKEGRGHAYRPLFPKEEYEAVSLRHLVGTVFEGAPVSLVQRLVQDQSLTPDELAAIRRLIATRKRT